MKTVPYVLSMWAIFTEREPATRFLDEIDDETKGKYIFKAEVLRSQGLEACIEHVWQAIPILKRSVMITMFLTRSSDRTGIAHPTPVDQGQHFIHNDPRVLPDERSFAHEFIPKAKDKGRKQLFTKVEETNEVGVDVVMRTGE